MKETVGTSLRSAGSPPRAVRLARLLLYVLAVAWLVFGIATLARPAGLAALDGQFLWVFSALMAVNAATLALAGWLLGLPRRGPWVFALGVLAVNIALTVTDQTGFADWATLAVAVVAAGLLIGARGWFAPGAQPD